MPASLASRARRSRMMRSAALPMRPPSATMPARHWPGPWKTAFSTARTATCSTRRARRRAPNARRSCGASSASILSLNTALSCACCIPHSRNCGAAPEPTAPGRFFRRKAPEKTHNLIRGGSCPLEHPRCSVDVPLWWNTERGKSFVRHIAPEKTAESNSRRVLPP